MPDGKTYTMDHGDEPLDAASRRARASFKLFWRELSWEYRRIVPALDMAAVKFPFEVPPGQTDAPTHEQMWVSDIVFDGVTIRGTLMNAPNFIETLSEGDAVSLPLSELTDWMYVMGGKVYGAYTVQVIRDGMTPEARTSHDEAWGLSFGWPDRVRLVPNYGDDASDAPSKKPGILGRLFSGGGKGESSDFTVPVLSDPDLTDLPEHAMSENAGPGVAKQLADDPGLATYTDEDGWTLLQRDALAGNLAPVQAMLAAGFDPHAPNPNGHSALDLARRMNWPRIVAAIEKKAN